MGVTQRLWGSSDWDSVLAFSLSLFSPPACPERCESVQQSAGHSRRVSPRGSSLFLCEAPSTVPGAWAVFPQWSPLLPSHVPPVAFFFFFLPDVGVTGSLGWNEVQPLTQGINS